LSGIVDVGDAIEVTFTTVPGATVLVSWLDPYQTAVLDNVAVTENPAASGKYPKTFIATSPGMWAAQFTASGTTAAIERYYVNATPLTGPAPLASVGDVVAQFGTMTVAQDGLTAYLVRAASALLRQRLRQIGLNIDADILAGQLDPQVATLTVANMVLRVLRNPNGLRSETTGPFSRTFDVLLAAGLLIVTDYDLGAVTTAPPLPDGTAGLGFGTIRIVPGMAPPVGWPSRGTASRPPYGRY
jgi:hypothetical protein